MTTKGADLNVADINILDKHIEILMDCKPLSENDVKQLCEKVKFLKPHSKSSFFLIVTFE